MARKHNQDNYFDMLVQSAEYSCKCAEMLKDFVENYPEDMDEVRKAIGRIHEIEHAADLHFHELFSKLMKEFLPPIDREDILDLAQRIDDLTDAIEAVAQRMYMLNIQTLRPDLPEFVSLISLSCKDLKLALEEFKYYKKSSELSKRIRSVGDVEEEGDQLYQKAVNELFSNTSDPIEIIKWREIYHRMEDCLDDSSEVADAISGVILKNS